GSGALLHGHRRRPLRPPALDRPGPGPLRPVHRGRRRTCAGAGVRRRGPAPRAAAAGHRRRGRRLLRRHARALPAARRRAAGRGRGAPPADGGARPAPPVPHDLPGRADVQPPARRRRRHLRARADPRPPPRRGRRADPALRAGAHPCGGTGAASRGPRAGWLRHPLHRRLPGARRGGPPPAHGPALRADLRRRHHRGGAHLDPALVQPDDVQRAGRRRRPAHGARPRRHRRRCRRGGDRVLLLAAAARL
ncbi:MAG: hypothetical protein AVDCRST_MAG20-2165, partial [uncultured Acidimicrobiales bacterium]